MAISRKSDGYPSRIAMIPLRCLTVMWTDAQRELGIPRAKRMGAEFDLRQFGTPVVQQVTDDLYHVGDGQTRIEAMRFAGYPQDFKVRCEVMQEGGKVEAAGLFLGRNSASAPKVVDKFLVSITAQDPIACDIERIVLAHGLRIVRASQDGGICAVTALQRVYTDRRFSGQEENPKALARTLEVATRAWGATKAALQGPLIEGVGLVVHRYGDVLDVESLTTKLAKVPGGANTVLSRGRYVASVMGKPVGPSVASVAVDEYNKGRRTQKLDDWWS